MSLYLISFNTTYSTGKIIEYSNITILTMGRRQKNMKDVINFEK